MNDINVNLKNRPQIKGYIIKGKNKSCEDALEEMANYLYKKGFVKKCYGQSVIARERVFPTGLPTEPIGTAMPHSEREDVLLSTILVGISNDGINFRRMDDNDETINAHVIFMLAVNLNEEQLNIMSELMTVLQDQEALKRVMDSRNVNNIEMIINNAFDRAEGK